MRLSLHSSLECTTILCLVDVRGYVSDDYFLEAKVFGKATKVKIDSSLYDKLRKVADVAGYATTEEFIEHILEKEMLHFEDAGSDDDVRAKLRGLGYIS